MVQVLGTGRVIGALIGSFGPNANLRHIAFHVPVQLICHSQIGISAWGSSKVTFLEPLIFSVSQNDLGTELTYQRLDIVNHSRSARVPSKAIP